MSRDEAIANIRSALQHRTSPRREMALIVTIAGLAGLSTSFGLLHSGITLMAIRYPLAVAAAYLVFLGCLWVWVRTHSVKIRSGAQTRRKEISSADLDVFDVPFSLKPSSPSFEFGQGGGFGGGGGGADWSASTLSNIPARSVVPAAEPSGSVSDADLDELGLLLLLGALVAMFVAGAALYVVLSAPTLLAEVLLDASLSAGLYHRLSGIESRSWWRSAIQQTLVPAIACAIIVSLAGGFVQSLYPEASSIGKVWQAAAAARHPSH